MGVKKIIAGLETISGPAALNEMVAAVGENRLVFSLDLKNRECFGQVEAWNSDDPREIARQVVALGVREILVLDLARVGSGQGTGTRELCAWLAETYPHLRVAAGGGIGSIEDVRKLEEIGVATVLVASALHDGRIRISPGSQRNSHIAD